LQGDPEKFRFEFDGTKLQRFPIPELDDQAREALVAVTRRLDAMGRELAEFRFGALITQTLASGADLRTALAEAVRRRDRTRSQMVRLQEELDWLCYELYGLLEAGSRARSRVWHEAPEQLAGMDPDLRPYRLLASEGSPPPADPVDRLRLEVIGRDKSIGLIERPEYKRRWFRSAGAYDDTNVTDDLLIERETREWLLDRLEDPRYWPSAQPQLTTCARLADRVRHDPEFLQVAELYRGRPDFDVGALVAELVEGEAVPFLPVLRYKPSGLRKREVWERTWELQRQEDRLAGEEPSTGNPAPGTRRPLDIPVPPKYQSADFLSGTFWRLRGKLDVPKERFVSYPHAQRDADPSLVIAWAGWNHLQQAQALAAHYLAMKENEGWTAERLAPLLAGLAELLPWLKQWHNDLDPAFGVRQGDYFRDFLAEELRAQGLTAEDLRAWTPPAKAGKRKGRRPKQESLL
jgi:hypothetical protein